MPAIVEVLLATVFGVAVLIKKLNDEIEADCLLNQRRIANCYKARSHASSPRMHHMWGEYARLLDGEVEDTTIVLEETDYS